MDPGLFFAAGVLPGGNRSILCHLDIKAEIGYYKIKTGSVVSCGGFLRFHID